MTSLKIAGLAGLFVWRIALGTGLWLSSSVHQVGDTVTLRCFRDNRNEKMFHWYKQTLGQKPLRVSSFYSHGERGTLTDEFKNFSRFSLVNDGTQNHLIISDLQISDSATYYCLGCTSVTFRFIKGITVNVKGSGLNIQHMFHRSGSETIQQDSVTLNCTVETGTCDGEHSVYWFKDSGKSHPGLIYTHGGRNDQCERDPESQTHSCVYNLPMKSLNISHAGIYYCAVASCGRILFGNGTKLDFEDEEHSPLLNVYSLSGALAFTILLNILLAFSLNTLTKRNGSHCTELQAGASAVATADSGGYEDSDNLHYAALREPRVSRTRRQREDTQSQCVYSSVKQ
uniref:Immunoglobulin kappa light chain-like n=1 Tax=Echeneis naucrates TaxID=173247 RepID=A0A665VIE8_ECHNA